MTHISLISNGYGEDSIGLKIATAITRQNPDIKITVIPLVGAGKVYQDNGYTPAIQNPLFPSGGFIRGLKDLWGDIKAGLIKHTLSQKKKIRHIVDHSDLSICVGDIFCLWMGRHSHKTIFLPTAKSDTFMSHSAFEKLLMKAHCTHIFTRDQVTATNLANADLPAKYVGNPMMDHLLHPDKTLPLNDTQPIIGILPGSRLEAYDNLKRLRPIIEPLKEAYPAIQFVVALAPQLNTENAYQILQNEHVLLSSQFHEIITRSWLMIGLAGTANEQAVAVGNTVIAFPGSGPQSSKKRFEEQQKLIGDGLIFVDSDNVKTIVDTIRTHLSHLKKAPKKHEANTHSAADKIAQTIQLEIQHGH